MTLSPGTRLGPCEIVGPLGADGLGEVFRARDARLGRDVAIKGLPEAFVEHAEWLSRFEREALEIGSQIAAAIEAAHERGIEHRDLKPGNVMITTSLTSRCSTSASRRAAPARRARLPTCPPRRPWRCPRPPRA